MIPKTQIFVAICLLFFAILPYTIQSKSNKKDPFGFLQHLEGCHKGQSIKGLKDLKRYLEKFGYLNYNGNKNHSNDNEFDDFLEKAIKDYQQNHHLNPTGTLDNSTINQIMKPRCGVPDVIKHNNNSKHPNHFHHQKAKSIHTIAHYNFIYPGPKRWPQEKTHLRYRFRSSMQVPTSQQTIRSICANAFQRWAQVTRFSFEEVGSDSEADIEIGFHSGNHGDGIRNSFDGPFKTLAHAFAPTDGRFHFDGDETWSTNPRQNEVDLESVAVHEIGHLLGLDHSKDPNAIMYDTFEYGRIKRDLGRDDIQGIRALYGLQ